jgi:hypothetical protein
MTNGPIVSVRLTELQELDLRERIGLCRHIRHQHTDIQDLIIQLHIGPHLLVRFKYYSVGPWNYGKSVY